jgi:hypothetical protein
MFFDINNIITENSNIIEIYLVNNIDNNKFKINNYITNDFLNKIRNKFKLNKETTLIYFNKNNLSYVYDLSNDNQFAFLRKLENTFITPLNTNYKLYGISYNEMKIQTHFFPCTNDIDSREEYKIEEYKINNRISIIIKNNNLYIYYKHSKDVDLEKIQEIINSIIKKMI